MIVLGFSLALLIGLSLGLLGGGGSILTVPVLHYVLEYGLEESIQMSLIVVGLTSAFGAAGHWRAGNLHWRAAMAFAPPAILGSVVGAELGLRVDDHIQLTVFSIVMLGAALSMLLGVRPAPKTWPHPLPLETLVGAAVGVLTGFVGVGGGFLYVPALVLLAGLAIRQAIGTSLVLILVSCIGGAIRYHGKVPLDWTAIAVFTGLAFVGVTVGSRLVPHVPQESLRRGFAVFLLGVGTLVLVIGR